MASTSSGTLGDTKTPPVIGERDIVFSCPYCTGELVVDRDGAGMNVPCPHCGEELTIPEYLQGPSSPSEASVTEARANATPAPARHFDFTDQSLEQLERRKGELQHQLKENRSQDTEMRGHVNRATMELHRLQLRLKKLQERQADIEAELGAIQAFTQKHAG